MESKYSSLTTESINKNTISIDDCSVREILELINNEDKKVPYAVEKEIDNISKAVEGISSRMKKGGHLIYIGAGTSGRLGVLDASECPPTFSTPKNLVQAYIAGGDVALRTAVENCEDDENAGRELIQNIGINPTDSVVGITASGSAKFVLAAIDEAKKIGCLTIALVNNKNTKLASIADIAIEPVVGPEVIQGSTRMKAGTAQKLVLNMISTATMIRLGKVYSNLMVDLHVSNSKLKDRGARIIERTCSLPYDKAMKLLLDAEFNVKEAILMEKTGLDYKTSHGLLETCDGNLAEALKINYKKEDVR